ncbi:DHA2 family efflux MFS transporter permease subunit [Terrilactibacillus sp. BCM23-1]|uniref:DHA2 family efflux MFS transporter permease subunit n=1 Tax=Terrilactibacillus tamarindi TaxID=2599694 RepID=A0A6N8CL73_9BACI|nr:DHA2 family efflux MFS transporter permease subunit [Terrilactibacillus tamarindi]MTT30609.1 DHA2 family efflux MFS transporter permease subunit [Terrilactibacillus tamarindi]
MTPILSGYIVFVIVVLILLNIWLRRRRLKKLATPEDTHVPSKALDKIDKNQTVHEDKVETNIEEFVTNGHPEEIETVREELHTVQKDPKEKRSLSRKNRTQHQDSHPDDIKPLPIIIVLIMGAFVAILNQTLMNVALPRIMTDLNITTNTAQWLTTGYMLVNGVLIPITAYLMETFTTRKLFISAIGLFALGTLICGLSPTFSILMVGRVIQAAGAGIIMPLMTNVFLTIFPPEKRGAAMGLMGVAMIFAPAIGPTLSGYLVEHYSWRILFWVIFPFTIIDIVFALIFLKNVGKRAFPKLDLLGAILSTIGFGGILYACSEAGNKGWTDAVIVSWLVIGVIALAIFVWRQLVVDSPLLELRVFEHKIFTITTIVNIVLTMAMFAGMVITPVYLQNIRGFTPLQSGLLLLPGAILMGIMSPITGILFDKIGARPLAIVGLIITAVTTWDFGHLTNSTPYSSIMVLYSARMFGMSLLMMPIMTEGLNNLPRRLNSHGTAMTNTMRQVAGSLGTAFLVTVMSNRTIYHQGQYANAMTTGNPNLTHDIAALSQNFALSHHLPASLGNSVVVQSLIGKVSMEAAIQGVNDAFIVATVLSVIALFLSFFIQRSTPSKKKRKIKKEKSVSEAVTE